MILKGSQRAGGRQLATHLLRADENEHVEVHEIRGFMADDLHAAFQEAYALSKGTRARKYLFSLSLNPPPNEQAPIEVFEAAIENIEQRLGLEDQPRAVIFHEKEGRRHAHAVWSRIDTEEMKAINLPHYKLKLRDIAREMYLEHGWEMPRGFVSYKERNPLNFSREEWQQARRTRQDPRELRQMFQECWAISDSRKAFAQALKSHGYILAQGERRGFVAVDYRGEVYAVARYTGVRTKKVREKLGALEGLPTIEKAKDQIAEQMTKKLEGHLREARKEQTQRSMALLFQQNQQIQRQREERRKLAYAQEERWNAESRARAERLAKGLRGIWHRLTGKYARVKRQNERETLLALQRDRKEKNMLIFRQMKERDMLHRKVHIQQHSQTHEIEQLRQEISYYRLMKNTKPLDLKKEFEQAAGQPRKGLKKDRTHKQDDGFEPEI